MEVYVSSIRTRAVGRYIEDGCCRGLGVTVMRGSTVDGMCVLIIFQSLIFFSSISNVISNLMLNSSYTCSPIHTVSLSFL